jgi:hypothetical protein
MLIGDQVPAGADDSLRRIAALEASNNQMIGLVGSAKALATAVQTGLGNLATSGTTWAGPVASPSTVTASTVTASSSVSAPQGTFSSGLSSVGAYNTNVSLLAGARQTVWQHYSGVYGYAPSSRELKTNLEPVPFTAADVLAVTPQMFQYKAQVAIREDPEHPNYDPAYVVPWEVGLMAEDLIAHNMACFVFWNEDGTPRGINYDLFGAVAPLVVFAELAKLLP